MFQFVKQVLQTGFIALCTIHSNITIFAPDSPCTLYIVPISNCWNVANTAPSDRQQPKAPSLLQAPATEQRGHSPNLLPTISNASLHLNKTETGHNVHAWESS